MATAELAPASLEPHYAPDDPSLPNPWKGLIDGGTGFLYYWNPETNVTQYERPTALHTDFLQGPPSTASPNLASSSIIGPPQQYGMVQQQVQQMPQLLGQQYLKQEGLPMLQQQAQQMPQKQQVQQQQMGNHVTPQQHGNQWPNPCQGLQLLDQNQGQQVPQQKGHQMLQHLGQQFSPQLQKNPYPQGQQISHLQGQQIPQQQGNQFGFSSSQVQNSRFTSINTIPAGTHTVHTPHTNFQPVHTQQSTSSSIDPPLTGGSLVQAQQSGMDAIHQKQVSDPMFQNKTGPPLSSYQQSGGPTIGLKLGFDDKHGRAGNEIQFAGNREKTMIIQHQPKLGAIPLAHNQQEMRMSSFHPQNVTADHTSVLNISVGHLMPNVYNHSTSGQAFPNNAPRKPSPRVLGTSDPSNAPMEPSPRILGASDLTNLSSADIYCRQHDVTALGDDVPPPFMTFEATGFPSEILRELKSAGFSSPTPIQAQTWPIALQSRDIVAIARTGSGKTLGYLLPAFLHLRRCQNNSQAGPTVVVMAPTRELATQIQDEAIKFGRSSRFSCTCLYGGAPKGPQLREIERGADIIVATPGRLNDILEMKKISFDQVSFLVLDEADRMLNMGFEPQIRKIVNEIPPRRQTLMYTATWPKEVRKIAGDLLVKPVQVNIGNIDELEANKAITQYVEVVPQMEKQRRLEQILRSQEPGAKVIIFCSTKRSCDQLARSIGRSFGAAAIHGDKAQGERDRVLNQFRSGKSPILVATDVAARGLDIKDIRSVVNYDFPTGVEDYVHRIGRTGRAGATGVSYTFFTDQDRKHAADLVKVLEGANQQVPPEIREMAARGGSGFSRGRGGVQRWDSGGGRWENGGRSGRDNGFSRGGRDSGFSRGGRDISRGGRADFFGSRGNRGRGGFGGAGSRGRSDQGRRDRYDSMDSRDRYNNPRGLRERNRGRSHSRSYSPSPDRVRTRDYNRSRSRSRSRSWTRSRSRSRSHSYDKYERPDGREVVLNPPSGSGGPPPSQISDGINSATDSSKQLVAEM